MAALACHGPGLWLGADDEGTLWHGGPRSRGYLLPGAFTSLSDSILKRITLKVATNS